MTEIAAIKNVLSQFAPAYPIDNVPDNVAYPYITFEPRVAFFDDGNVPVQLNVWHRTDSDAAINAIVRDIGRGIDYGGLVATCDSGWIWIKRGTPFVVPVAVPDDDAVKRRLINILIEYVT